MDPAPLHNGLIVAAYGRHFLVETPEGNRLICHSRGKRSQGLVGDRILWLATGSDGTVERSRNEKTYFTARIPFAPSRLPQTWIKY